MLTVGFMVSDYFEAIMVIINVILQNKNPLVLILFVKRSFIEAKTNESVQITNSCYLCSCNK